MVVGVLRTIKDNISWDICLDILLHPIYIYRLNENNQSIFNYIEQINVKSINFFLRFKLPFLKYFVDCLSYLSAKFIYKQKT